VTPATITPVPPGAAVVPAFRSGSTFRLERDGDADEPTRIILPAGVRLKRNGRGRLMVYRYGTPFGVTLGDALALGWCSVAREGP
jgi:hypothetical protein